MSEINPAIHQSWKPYLMEAFKLPYFSDLKRFLLEEMKKYVIYPAGPQIFSAFNHTPFDEVKVVIIGQDPYHGSGQANGLCFSVSNGIKPPPSLVNIFKEINSNLGLPIPHTGNLEPWAKQGVLLLNATLTVRANSPRSHQNRGWEQFTDTVIKVLSEQKQGLVFLLWGKYAQAKEILIDTTKHQVLKAAHPSPFSAHNGFFGCGHFGKTNKILSLKGLPTISWSV